MYCPTCGSEENQNVQFCRKCGADLDVVRSASLDSSKLGGSGPKSEIARAFVTRIESLSSARQLRKAAQEVLPEIEKFLETPEEKRLRGVRQGSLVTLIGLGTAIAFTVVSMIADNELIILAGFGFVTFLIGLALMINSYFFTVPKQRATIETGNKPDPKSFADPANTTNDLLMPPSAQSQFGSVTDHTTRTLDEKELVDRDWKKGE